jgi:hypothetical protein
MITLVVDLVEKIGNFLGLDRKEPWIEMEPLK